METLNALEEHLKDRPLAMQNCLSNCRECHQICSLLIEHCLNLGGKHAEPDHIKMLMDCAQICQTAADFMIRNSDFHAGICDECAIICDACADDCEALDPEDAMMKACIEVCRVCATSCEQMTTIQ